MNPMTVDEMCAVLRRKQPDNQVVFDFMHYRPGGLDSYRGYYDQLALGYTTAGEVSVKELLTLLEDAIGKMFTGWKGGEYHMYGDTPVWVGNPGECGDTAIVDILDKGWRIVLVTGFVDA